ncbi:MAG: TetR family transcriptional regulator [Anaerolineae bacterium]|nr:TetR family transcriptional regulator [Anaerolineae bacterium]
MEKNAEATKSRILKAATDEFASYGFAGARVDRIAAAAGCNKQLIYAYFGGKQELFDALARDHILAVLDAVPIDANNLPEYAARLFDYNRSHPQLIRLVQWYTLEGVESPAATALTQQSMLGKVEAIQAAQKSGLIRSALPAEELLTLVLSISNAWEIGMHNFQDGMNTEACERHRRSIIMAVQKLIS